MILKITLSKMIREVLAVVASWLNIFRGAQSISGGFIRNQQISAAQPPSLRAVFFLQAYKILSTLPLA